MDEFRPPSYVIEGHSCSHCEGGIPIDAVQMRSGHKIYLCLECVMLWFPQWDVTDWEEHHTFFADHIDVALQESQEREGAAAMAARGG